MLGKIELVNRVAEKTTLTKATVENVLNTVIATVVEELGKGEEVNIKGFVSFKVAEKPAHNGRNPKTGEIVKIPSKKVVKAKVATNIRSALN